jgi:hypothetical protein
MFCITSTLASNEDITLNISVYEPASHISVSCIMSPCPKTTICGDGICFLESCETCPQDCGTCIPTCSVLSMTNPADGDSFTFLALNGTTVACRMRGVDGDVDMTVLWGEELCAPLSYDSNEFCITSTLASDENVTLVISVYEPDTNITISRIMSPISETNAHITTATNAPSHAPKVPSASKCSRNIFLFILKILFGWNIGLLFGFVFCV